MLVDDQSKESGEPSHKLHSNYIWPQEVAANDSVNQKVVGCDNQVCFGSQWQCQSESSCRIQ